MSSKTTQIYTAGYSHPLSGNSINPQLSVWDWNLCYSSEQILQFHNRGYDPEHCPDSWLPRQQPSFMVPELPSSAWLFSRGALTPLNQLRLWWDRPSLLPVSSHWLPWPAVSSESLIRSRGSPHNGELALYPQGCCYLNVCDPDQALKDAAIWGEGLMYR